MFNLPQWVQTGASVYDVINLPNSGPAKLIKRKVNIKSHLSSTLCIVTLYSILLYTLYYSILLYTIY